MNLEVTTLGEMSQIGKKKKSYDLICMCKLKKPNSQKLKVDGGCYRLVNEGNGKMLVKEYKLLVIKRVSFDDYS